MRFGYEDPYLDRYIDNDDWDDDDEQEVDTTRSFQPFVTSTPYHGGEQHEMQTMMHEQIGLPDTSYEDTPLLRGASSITDAEIERRLKALREDPITGIIDTTKIMDTSVNPLSDIAKDIQIEKVKNLITKKYPNADLKKNYN